MQHLLKNLEEHGDLKHVERQVNPEFELAAVTKALQDSSNEVVMFHDVAGSDIPVVSNIYGSHERLLRMVGAAPGQSFCARWIELTEACLGAKDETVYVPAKADVDGEFITCKLSDLPALTWHGRDGGAYFTSAVYLANDPDTGVPNLSFHRSQQISDDELRVRLGGPHDLTQYQKRAEAKGEPLEAALLLSCPPELFLGACASLPIDASELAMAAQIRGEKIAMRKCKTIGLEVPASVDIVVEGRFLPNERRPEGPFGEFMGFYVEVGDNHVFEVTHVERRRDAVLHGLLCGSNEDLRPLEAVIAAKVYGHVSRMVPGVLDVSCKPNVMISIIKIDKQYEGHGKHAILAALGSHLDYNKVVIAVDSDVDIYNLDDVMWAYMTRGRADTRAQVLHDFPGFYRDEKKDHWGRLTIDATMPWGREAEFARKSVPGVAAIDLTQYLKP
ncbi:MULTISPECIES: UbiD family decarboxylase [unclassified Sulfitobacter]|uniref:UbiD family decarboxylase n=1 Tax=unclassified Sulfitobacter TaxID=196795 RepID=UPI0023E1AFAA|nr:UbiD family decarboxylase [Sulfitobacter sp. Ks41]MDF3362461.1 UbiD family decarboxylase [Sulfitobacter sp. Ks41]|tara:strand:- start:1694 stop:3028 length:1335 start_codon:yes stop_codon:yes gene_type:complete